MEDTMSTDVRIEGLPDLDSLLEQARDHRAKWAATLAQAQAEVNRADEYIARLTGKPVAAESKPPARKKGADKKLLDQALELIANRGESGTSAGQVQRALHVSASHTSVVISQLERDGLIVRRKHGRAFRSYATDAGVDRATS